MERRKDEDTEMLRAHRCTCTCTYTISDRRHLAIYSTMSERKKISFGTDVKEGTRAGSASADQQARHSSNPTTKPASSFPPDTVSQARRARIEAAIGRTIPSFPVRGATPDQLAQAGEISDLLRTEFSFRTPDRGLEGLEDSDVNWREGKKPDYTVRCIVCSLFVRCIPRSCSF